MIDLLKEKLKSLASFFTITWNMLVTPYRFASDVGDDKVASRRAALYFFTSISMMYGVSKLIEIRIIEVHYKKIISLPWGDEILALYLFATTVVYSLLIYLSLRLHHIIFYFTYCNFYQSHTPTLNGCVAVVLYGVGYLGLFLVAVDGTTFVIHRVYGIDVVGISGPYGAYILGLMLSYAIFLIIPALGAGKYLASEFWLFGITFFPVVSIPIGLFQFLMDEWIMPTVLLK